MSKEIVVVSLGFLEGDLTEKGYNAIKNAEVVIARTNLAKSFNSVKKIREDVISLDDIYLKSRNFDTLNKNLALEVINKSKDFSVAYCVDGVSYEDNSVKEILKKNKNVKILGGVSSTSFALETFNIYSTNVTSYSAYNLCLEIATTPIVVFAIDSSIMATNVKLKLMEYYKEDTKVYFYNGSVSVINLYELDRFNVYDYSTCIFIDKQPLIEKKKYNFYDLLEITRILRSENGCPWDKAQTKTSVLPNLIEETYELVDAVNLDDENAIIEETGDVLLQCAFQIVFGEESGLYNSNDILSEICNKLISRHSHVFGKDKANSEKSALEIWNKNKRIEKNQQTGTYYLKAIPYSFPALLRAEKMSSRASKYNLKFENVEEIYSKIIEELNEVKEEVKNGDKDSLIKELGDLLFSVTSLIKFLDVSSEMALNRTINGFLERFEKLESLVIKDGKDLKTLSREEVENYYNKAKDILKNGN